MSCVAVINIPVRTSFKTPREVCQGMPDTKRGRERKGRGKQHQLREQLYDRELESLDGDEELDFESLLGGEPDADSLLDEESAVSDD